MKKMMISLVLLASASAGATPVTSVDDTLVDGIRLGNPTYGGTGCPQGSAAVALSPDESSISILFDTYVAEAGGARRIDRKSCNLAIPVHVPAGMSISLISMDYRGFTSVPSGGSAVFNAEYFFAGGSGPIQSQTFRGPRNDDFTITHEVPMEAQIWSPCGQDVILRANTSMRAMTNSRGDQVLATVDSQDVHGSTDGGFFFFIEERNCN